MSGYLIFISLQNSKNILSYLWKRVLRIFPALVGLLVVTGVILSFVSKNPQFVITKEFLQYCVDVLSLYKVRYVIGENFSTNPYPSIINGSLWSLSYEFTMYIMVGSFFWFRKSKAVLYIILVLFFVCSYLYITDSVLLKKFFSKMELDVVQLYKLEAYFLGGCLLTFVNTKAYNTLLNRSILFAILLISLFLNCFKEVSLFILPLFIILVANASTPYLNSIAKKTGDLSYGIYIYGFLVQQTLVYYLDLETWPLTLFSLIISAILAYCSWNLIEKRMMKFKNLL